jgi:hypothetical protein
VSDTIRFPFTVTVPGVSAPEFDQIIILDAAVGTIVAGGTLGNSIVAWRLDQRTNAGFGTASPYGCVVIEIVADAAGIAGNGTTDLIGLYGTISDADGAGTSQRYLLGILGVNLGNALPQIPFVLALDGKITAYAQAVNLVACYDSLSIGGVTGDVSLGGLNLLVTGRPVRRRVFGD